MDPSKWEQIKYKVIHSQDKTLRCYYFRFIKKQSLPFFFLLFLIRTERPGYSFSWFFSGFPPRNIKSVLSCSSLDLLTIWKTYSHPGTQASRLGITIQDQSHVNYLRKENYMQPWSFHRPTMKVYKSVLSFDYFTHKSDE